MTPKCFIYVKLDEHDIFTPLQMEDKTVASLLAKLELKFGSECFQASKVGKVFQRNKKKFIFHLDDDMMEYIQPHEVFNIEITEDMDESEMGGEEKKIIREDLIDENIAE